MGTVFNKYNHPIKNLGGFLYKNKAETRRKKIY